MCLGNFQQQSAKRPGCESDKNPTELKKINIIYGLFQTQILMLCISIRVCFFNLAWAVQALPVWPLLLLPGLMSIQLALYLNT